MAVPYISRACKACGGLFVFRDYPCMAKRSCCSRECASCAATKLSCEDVVRMVGEGRTTTEIAVRFGCTRECVNVHRARLGIAASKANRGAANGMYGRTHTPEARAKLRAANARQFATPEARARHGELTGAAIISGKFGRTSKLETTVGEVLRTLGVEADAQYCVRGVGGRFIACVDFYLPSRRVALEVNGTFWHADPRVYDASKLKPAQVRTLTRYAVKVEALSVLGIGVIEVWEQDLRVDAVQAVRAALKVA